MKTKTFINYGTKKGNTTSVTKKTLFLLSTALILNFQQAWGMEDKEKIGTSRGQYIPVQHEDENEKEDMPSIAVFHNDESSSDDDSSDSEVFYDKRTLIDEVPDDFVCSSDEEDEMCNSLKEHSISIQQINKNHQKFSLSGGSVGKEEKKDFPKNSQKLVTKNQENFDVNPDFQELAPDLLEWGHLAYQTGKEHDPKVSRKGYKRNWEEEIVLKGKTGGDFEDYPGLVTYTPELNFIAIVFRGSCKFGDWCANVDGRSTDNEEYMPAKKKNFKFKGDYRRGFLEKYEKCKGNLEESINYFFNKLEKNKKETLRFVVTGHSQGGALATIASMDLVTDFLKTKYGPNFDNAKDNKLYGWYLSPASIAPYFFLDQNKHSPSSYCNEIVGKHNMIWQTVRFDMVTCVGFDQLPFLENYLLPDYPGHIAITHTFDAFAKALEIARKTYGGKCKSGREYQCLVDLYNVLFKDFNKTGIFSSSADLLLAKDRLSYIIDIAWNIVAFTHYGSSKHDTRGAFDPEMVEVDFNKVLKHGEQYENKCDEISNTKEQLKNQCKSILTQWKDDKKILLKKFLEKAPPSIVTATSSLIVISCKVGKLITPLVADLLMETSQVGHQLINLGLDLIEGLSKSLRSWIKKSSDKNFDFLCPVLDGIQLVCILGKDLSHGIYIPAGCIKVVQNVFIKNGLNIVEYVTPQINSCFSKVWSWSLSWVWTPTTDFKK